MALRIEEMTDGQFQKYQEAVVKHCYYGRENGCDGKPLVHRAKRKPPCPYYEGRCQKPEIRRAKDSLEFRVKYRN